MQERIEELCLSRDYSVFVSIENNGTHFAGELFLTPAECTLVIRGDTHADRNMNLPYGKIDKLVCKGFDGKFIALGLELQTSHRRALERGPLSIWHFENRYSVSSVVLTRGPSVANAFVHAIELESPSLARWVGQTSVQDQIVQMYAQGTLFPYGGFPLEEFSQTAGDLGTMQIVYSPGTHYSSEDFSMALRFSPILRLTFANLKNTNEALHAFSQLETLFSLLTGQALDIQIIRLISAAGGRYHPSLYIPRGKILRAAGAYDFFPLAINLRAPRYRVSPAFPLNSINAYFELSADDRRFFEKYLIYRRLGNPDERFLGFFRLLEKLCFQKDFFLDSEKLDALIERAERVLVRMFGNKKDVVRFLKSLPRHNATKLNAASFIGSFLKTVPKELLDTWIYSASDMASISKTRNDLTHANQFEPEEHEMARKAKFIEALLVLRLLCKIEVPIEVGAEVMPRLEGHDLILRKAEPTIESRSVLGSSGV